MGISKTQTEAGKVGRGAGAAIPMASLGSHTQVHDSSLSLPGVPPSNWLCWFLGSFCDG